MIMTNIYKLFKDEIWQPEDYTKNLWYQNVDELYYTTGSVDELMNGDGDTYSYRVCAEHERDGFIIVALQNDCGGDLFQAIFDLSKKVDEDKYWEDVDAEEDEDE